MSWLVEIEIESQLERLQDSKLELNLNIGNIYVRKINIFGKQIIHLITGLTTYKRK